MESPGRLEKVMEILAEMMIKETVKTPTRYSEAYLSGRDLLPVLPQTQQPHSSKQENLYPNLLERPVQSKPKPKPKTSSKTKESVKEPLPIPQQPTEDWTDYISNDVKSMNEGLPINPLSDAYIVNMTPKAINLFMTQKFMSPLKNIGDSILRSGINNLRSIEEDAVSSEELKLSIRCAVGKIIKNKISKLDNVPEQLKKDIEIVFN